MGDRRYVRPQSATAPRRNHVPAPDPTVSGYLRAEQEETRAKDQAAVEQASRRPPEPRAAHKGKPAKIARERRRVKAEKNITREWEAELAAKRAEAEENRLREKAA